MANPSRRYVSLKAAAEYLDVSERTVRRLITDGLLTGFRLGKRLIRVDLNEVNAIMRAIPNARSL